MKKDEKPVNRRYQDTHINIINETKKKWNEIMDNPPIFPHLILFLATVLELFDGKIQPGG